MNIVRNIKDIRSNDYIIATYDVESKTTLQEAAWAIAVGQSVGNPNVRNEWETDALFEKHCCKIIDNGPHVSDPHWCGPDKPIRIAFPLANINLQQDGVSQLLCQLMGGQMDIDIITKCVLTNIQFPPGFCWEKPRYGIDGIREYVGSDGKPLLGGIIKPKTGLSPKHLTEMVLQLARGGVDFIKEDEIMANPSFCPLEERVPMVMKALKEFEQETGKRVIYAVCINGDTDVILERAEMVARLGANAIHINFWSGLGTYRAVRALDLPLFLFYQKSGDKVISTGKFSIDWSVMCHLAALSGIDFIHAGMWGGYLDQSEAELCRIFDVLYQHDVLPSLSCGMHPGLVQAIRERFGNDWMANCGGAIHGHPEGTVAGAQAMRSAIDMKWSEAYQHAIDKWGLVK